MELIPVKDFSAAVAAMAPGFIFLFLRSLFISGRMPSLKEGVLYYAALSIVYYAVAEPPLTALISSEHWRTFVMSFAAPAALGIIAGIAYQKGFGRWVANKAGLRIMHAAPTAWDYAFGKLSGYHWIHVRLRDGSDVYGIFGPESFATTGENGFDLYIEEVTQPQYVRMPRKAGLWIRRDSIDMVEIIQDEGATHD